MLIKNVYRRPLKFMFVEKPITIGSNEVLEVSDGIGKEMLKNPWITEYLDRKCSKCFNAGKIKDSGNEFSEIPKIQEIPEIKKSDKENKREIKSKKVDNQKLKTK